MVGHHVLLAVLTDLRVTTGEGEREGKRVKERESVRGFESVRMCKRERVRA
jgi:hypothetical protein